MIRTQKFFEFELSNVIMSIYLGKYCIFSKFYLPELKGVKFSTKKVSIHFSSKYFIWSGNAIGNWDAGLGSFAPFKNP